MSEAKPKRNWLMLLAGLMIGLGMGIVILFGLGLTGNLAGLGISLGSSPTTESVAVGSPAPDFELTSLTGERIQLRDLRGKPVLINFWATWCPPCVQEMPRIQTSFQNHSNSFVVLAVNASEAIPDVQKFVGDMGLTFNILLDPTGSVQELYRLRAFPTSFFVDAKGVIRAEHIGIMTGDQIQNYLLKIGVTP